MHRAKAQALSLSHTIRAVPQPYKLFLEDISKTRFVSGKWEWWVRAFRWVSRSCPYGTRNSTWSMVTVTVARALVVGGVSCMVGRGRTYGEAWVVAHLALVHVGVVDEGALGTCPLRAHLIYCISWHSLSNMGQKRGRVQLAQVFDKEKKVKDRKIWKG